MPLEHAEARIADDLLTVVGSKVLYDAADPRAIARNRAAWKVVTDHLGGPEGKSFKTSSKIAALFPDLALTYG